MGAITEVLPSLNRPAVVRLYRSDRISIEAILPEREVRSIIPAMMNLGSEWIVESPLNTII